jgi:molybdopterin-guanine dinucleotide biosynthesis protein A
VTGPDRARCTGVVLAGGSATRFGGIRKGLERVGTRRIIDRVADALRAATDDLLLVANDPDAGNWLPGVRVVSDVRPGAGSLGGIYTALWRSESPALVVAWDMPFVTAGLLTALRALGETGVDVAVPESGSHRGFEPLCAYYTPACLEPIKCRLEAGDHRMIGFYPDVRLARLPLTRVAQFGDPAHLFVNVNTADDLVRAEAWIASSRT